MQTDRDEFIEAYVITALWSSVDDVSGDNLDDPRFRLPRATRECMSQEAGAWFDAYQSLMQAAIDTGDVRYGPDFGPYGRAGHDFWLTRNGHGVGFWDGDWPEPFAEQLTEAAKRAGGRDLYVSRGWIYQA